MHCGECYWKQGREHPRQDSLLERLDPTDVRGLGRVLFGIPLESQ